MTNSLLQPTATTNTLDPSDYMEDNFLYLLNSELRRLLLLVVHKAVALGVAPQVRGDLAGEDVAERGEGVMQGLVVDALVQVFDEDVAHSRLAEGGVAVAPHDAHGLALAILDTLCTVSARSVRQVHRVSATHKSIPTPCADDSVQVSKSWYKPFSLSCAQELEKLTLPRGQGGVVEGLNRPLSWKTDQENCLESYKDVRTRQPACSFWEG